MAYNYQQQQTLMASTANGAANISKPFSVNGFRQVRIDIDVTAFTGTSITFKVQYYDNAKAAYVDIGLATAAISATGHSTLHLGLDIQTAANSGLNCVLPPRLQLVSTGTFTVATYSVLLTKQS